VLLFLLVEQGYEPDIYHTCCKTTNIRFRVNNINFIIRTQQLIKHGLHASIFVDNEQTYNKMNQATTTIK
jgi:hypothetical protein